MKKVEKRGCIFLKSAIYLGEFKQVDIFDLYGKIKKARNLLRSLLRLQNYSLRLSD